MEPQAQSLTRADADDAAADAAAAEEAGSLLASALARALRFADKERALVRLTSGSVTATSPRGTIIVPWDAPTLPADGVVVDGRRLHRCLRAAGPVAQLRVDSARLVVSFGARRFSLALVPEQIDAHVPTRDGVDFQPFFPSVFRAAAAFSGDDKIEPPELSGVNISRGGCIACDRRGLIATTGATGAQLVITLPRDTFDGLSVGEDGSDVVYLGVSSEGHAVIVDPRTGEWRVVVAWSPSFPDVRGVLSRWDAALTVDIDKAAFVSALKQFRIVQSAGSSVKFRVWTTAPADGAAAGDWIEMEGGDPGVACQFVARLGVRIQRLTPVGVPGHDTSMIRVCFALDELLKLAAAHPGDVVRLGFGKDERSPLIVKNAAFEAGVMPMVDR
jgi:hypothetical protein